MNGDGLADLLVGARQDSGSDFASGAAYVVFGKADSSAISLDDVAMGTGGFKNSGENLEDNAGISVSSAGDVNGDGRADVLVGAWKNEAGGSASGAAYVVFGTPDGPASTLTALPQETVDSRSLGRTLVTRPGGPSLVSVT